MGWGGGDTHQACGGDGGGHLHLPPIRRQKHQPWRGEVLKVLVVASVLVAVLVAALVLVAVLVLKVAC